jgi:hypothetical protein
VDAVSILVMYLELTTDQSDTVPEWYHCSSRTGKVYRGDNHPKDSSHDLPADLWEKTPRKCRNCGEIELCLIPGYTCTNWLCQ